MAATMPTGTSRALQLHYPNFPDLEPTMPLMSHISRPLAVLLCMAVLLCACGKLKKKSNCDGTLHGYTASLNSMNTTTGLAASCSHGIINTGTGTIATSGTFPGSVLVNNKATFNTHDKCYYVFGYTGSSASYTRYLVRITDEGVSKSFTLPTATYSSLIYNSNNEKLYCIRDWLLCEVTVETNAVSIKVVANPVHAIDNNNITVDPSSGDIYFVSYDSLHYYVERYHPGGSASTVVATCPDNAPIFELRYNKSDKNLYALKRVTQENHAFVKIDPSSGKVDVQALLNGFINGSMFSATLDPCSGRYIISTSIKNPLTKYVMYQLNMNGNIEQTDTTATFYQGLDMAY